MTFNTVLIGIGCAIWVLNLATKGHFQFRIPKIALLIHLSHANSILIKTYRTILLKGKCYAMTLVQLCGMHFHSADSNSLVSHQS